MWLLLIRYQGIMLDLRKRNWVYSIVVSPKLWWGSWWGGWWLWVSLPSAFWECIWMCRTSRKYTIFYTSMLTTFCWWLVDEHSVSKESSSRSEEWEERMGMVHLVATPSFLLHNWREWFSYPLHYFYKKKIWHKWKELLLQRELKYNPAPSRC
jgi:hypothetical protein